MRYIQVCLKTLQKYIKKSYFQRRGKHEEMGVITLVGMNISGIAFEQALRRHTGFTIFPQMGHEILHNSCIGLKSNKRCSLFADMELIKFTFSKTKRGKRPFKSRHISHSNVHIFGSFLDSRIAQHAIKFSPLRIIYIHIIQCIHKK